MTPLVATFLSALGTTVAAFLILWVVGTWRRDVSIVDSYWGLGFVVIAWQSLAMNGFDRWRPILLAILTTVWGVRLAIHVFARNLAQGEDRRYTAMRKPHGERFWWVSLFTVFLLQAGILWFLSWPLLASAASNGSVALHWLDAIGIACWTIGFLFEAFGDWQLSRFKANPANRDRVMDQGLWRYTRHPNYFGECLLWWGVYSIACVDGAWWSALSPILLTFLLLRVSGVTMVEADIADRRPEYREYKTTTNAFFPGPRRTSQQIRSKE
jgi:steroid 5-alpha reductase family enzyme